MSSREIHELALKLPPKRRAALAEELLASLDKEAIQVIDRTWAREIESRIDAYDRGETKAQPIAKVLKRLDRRYKR